MQFPEQSGDASPGALPYTPAGHRVQAEAPAAEYDPGEQRVQVALEVAPMAALKVPAGQGVGGRKAVELKAQ